MRRLSLVMSCLLLAACSGYGDGRNTFYGSDSDSSESGDSSEETDSASGDGDAASGDGDGDTTSGDGDGDVPTSTSGDGDGDMPTSTSGDGDGDMPTSTGGDGDGDEPPGCTRKRYTYQANQDSWESVPLDAVWTGPNAPPCDLELLAASYIEVWDQLYVWGSDGRFYRRVNGTWQPPEPTGQRWGVVADIVISGVTYIAPNGNNEWAGVLFGTPGLAYVYRAYEDGGTVYVESIVTDDGLPPAPPAGSLSARWGATWCKLNLWPNPEWLSSYSYYGNGLIYQQTGFGSWESWTVANSPLFDNAPNGLDVMDIEVAWGSTGPDRVHVVAP